MPGAILNQDGVPKCNFAQFGRTVPNCIDWDASKDTVVPVLHDSSQDQGLGIWLDTIRHTPPVFFSMKVIHKGNQG